MANQVDIYVGKRIRHRRWVVGLSQQELGEKVGVKFQQIQKYETGSNRVSASKLWEMSHALNVPLASFFQGFKPCVEGEETLQEVFLADYQATIFLAGYYKISEGKRRAIYELAMTLAEPHRSQSAEKNSGVR
ncbi:helix-turn-helix transcriptional regulator [uncultured Roseovarius sp.]|uniref:helix-turn-helix domain-containing protein n=1 Tax=uncultured Roseovarius sp. TaxID=293344 RepID=UPI00260597EE|nr:helix-turn-helix transcriptional regulator [uncultured Roseovarius sp.]